MLTFIIERCFRIPHLIHPRYGDDTALITTGKNDMRDLFKIIMQESLVMGLLLNTKEMKILTTAR